VIDYGVGNLFSIKRALERINLEVKIVKSIDDLAGVDAIILPGVGSFRSASENIEPMKDGILSLLDDGVILFGICLGMQLLFEWSEESHDMGLGLLEGRVVRLPASVKIPHMGWNTLRIVRWCKLLDGIDEMSYFYFLHSYYAEPADQGIIVAKTSYGVEFTSVLEAGNILGTQFHPEKSGKSGLKILRNFAEIVRR